ncbi:MAG TPA: alpha/beta fold hydrolase [Burkholderiaceae bacterium]|nr:alpha/beta fold hydrolase [Burkholderiaceae bacterium]
MSALFSTRRSASKNENVRPALRVVPRPAVTTTGTVTTADGFALAVTTFGDAKQACAAVLIAPAMGVEQHYYAPFAEALAAAGFYVVTFDYRGMGHSRPAQFRRSLRGLEADVSTWATRDAAAIVEFAAACVGERPLLWIGHSLGGQILGLVPNHDRVLAMLTVAAGSGYWPQNSKPLRYFVPALWFAIAPVAVALCGYFPGRLLRMVGDLPAGVMRQWRRWCLSREYAVGAEGDEVRAAYAGVSVPILSLSFTDDALMSRASIEALHALYTGARREMQRIAPRDFGLTQIGHFGFFRKRFADLLWPLALRWLNEQVAIHGRKQAQRTRPDV